MKSIEPLLMIYGANGYSAQLIIEECLTKNIKPILAGRNVKSVQQLAQKYNCDFRTFDLSDDKVVDSAIEDVHTLINCAGPFKFTAKELIEACLRTKTNYLDITGEIPVLHLAFSKLKDAIRNKIIILPSVGFDIIPTDCLAKRMSELMPDAKYLKLGLINNRGKISRGTLLTTLEFLAGKGMIRRDNKLIESGIGELTVNVKLKDFSFKGISIPWGDVYSTIYSTKISNAEVYLAVSDLLYYFRNFAVFFLKILKIKFIKKLISAFIKKNITGPSKQERDSAKTFIWCRVENTKGEMKEEVYQVMEGYNLTAKGAVECALRVMRNNLKPGVYTPALAFGSDFLNQFVIETVKKKIN